jgi:hypothetical protein
MKTSTTSSGNWMDDGASATQTKKAPGKGMQLGKPKKQNELMKDLQKEKIYSAKAQDAFPNS